MSRRRSGGHLGLGLSLAVSACSDTEALAQSGRETGPSAFFIFGLVGFANTTEGGEALFHCCVAHTTGVEGPVEVVGQTAAVSGLSGFRLRGYLWSARIFCVSCAFCVSGILTIFCLLGLCLGRVEVNTTGGELVYSFMFLAVLDSNLPEWASARNIHQPGVNAFHVELVVAGQNT